jgi:hypothetical protein
MIMEKPCVSAFSQVRGVPPAGFEPAAFCSGDSSDPCAAVYRGSPESGRGS